MRNDLKWLKISVMTGFIVHNIGLIAFEPFHSDTCFTSTELLHCYDSEEV